MPDNRMDKLHLDPPTLLINSSANLCLWAHAQKINMTASMVTAVNCTCELFFRKLPSRIIEV